MSEAQISEGASPVVETTTATASEPVKETFDQTFERVADEVFNRTPERGSDGKFQPRVVAQGAPEAVEVPGSPQGAAPDPVQPVIKAPQSLPADVSEEWSKAPPKLQQWLEKREAEIHQKFTTDGERLKTLTAFEEVLKPLDARLKQVNAPPHEYVRRLAAADQLLATNGLEGLRQIAQMYGIDLRAAAQIGNQPGPQLTPQVPNVEALVDEKVQKVLYEQRVAQREGEIEKFKTALPVDEQPDFDTLADTMAGLAQANPKWSLDQLYKAARKVNPDTVAKDEAKAKAEAAKAAEEEAKKKADQDRRLGPQSTRPGSTPTGPIKGKSIWDTMDKVAKEVMART